MKVVARALSLSLVFAASAARADDTWVLGDSGAKATHDCGKQPHVAINGSHDQVTLTGVCATVAIHGDGVTIVADAISAIAIHGVGDVVDVGAVGRIALTGAQHRVTWKAAMRGKRPQVSDLGTGDTVAQAPTPPAPAPAAP